MDEREFELKKLELGLVQEKERRDSDLKERELRLTRQKFWIGSVAVVLITGILNWQIQRREVALKQIEEENQHLSQFVESILDRDPLTRLFIAEYFQTLSSSQAARERWGSYRVIAQSRAAEGEQAERKRRELQVRLQEILEEIADPDTSPERRRQLQGDLLEAEIDIDRTQKLLAALNPAKEAKVRAVEPLTNVGSAVVADQPSEDLCIEVLGEPGSRQTRMDLPYPLELAWDRSKRVSQIVVHELAEPYFMAAFREIQARGLEDEATAFGGSFAKVKQRGQSGRWSLHSWGIEIDLNPAENKLHWGRDRFQQHPGVVEAFENNGFFWRGRLNFDAMAFVLSAATLREIGGLAQEEGAAEGG